MYFRLFILLLALPINLFAVSRCAVNTFELMVSSNSSISEEITVFDELQSFAKKAALIVDKEVSELEESRGDISKLKEIFIDYMELQTLGILNRRQVEEQSIFKNLDLLTYTEFVDMKLKSLRNVQFYIKKFINEKPIKSIGLGENVNWNGRDYIFLNFNPEQLENTFKIFDSLIQFMASLPTSIRNFDDRADIKKYIGAGEKFYKYYRQIHLSIEGLFKTYRVRKGVTESFVKDKSNDMDYYIKRSSFFSVSDKDKGLGIESKGMMRIVSSEKLSEQLPLEKNNSIQIKRDKDEIIIEMGSYFLADNIRKEFILKVVEYIEKITEQKNTRIYFDSDYKGMIVNKRFYGAIDITDQFKSLGRDEYILTTTTLNLKKLFSNN